MKIKTISNMSFMNYKYFLEQPMQMIERRLSVLKSETNNFVK